MRNIALVTSPGGIAKGQITFDGAAPPATVPSGLQVQAVDADALPILLPGGSVRPDWTFESRGLTGHRILRVAGVPAGWFLKSVTLDGSDITDTGMEFHTGQEISGIEVVLTRTAAEVSGTVQDSKGAAVTDYVLVLFAADADKWGFQSRYVRAVRPDQTGRFIVNGLPAASYLAVALDYLEPGQETDPEFLERLKGLATTVRVADGEKKGVTLKLSAQ